MQFVTVVFSMSMLAEVSVIENEALLKLYQNANGESIESNTETYFSRYFSSMAQKLIETKLSLY